MKSRKQKDIESKIGAPIYIGWVLDGAGPGRYGWYAQFPCKQHWLGRTFVDVETLVGDARTMEIVKRGKHQWVVTVKDCAGNWYDAAVFATRALARAYAAEVR